MTATDTYCLPCRLNECVEYTEYRCEKPYFCACVFCAEIDEIEELAAEDGLMI